MRKVLCATGLLLCLQVSTANVCGHCVEDKIAAVYDYAVVTQAHSQQHQVVFFAIDGTYKPDEGLRRSIETMVKAIDGVNKGSVRVSLELAALSAAFDPKKTSSAAMQKTLEQKLISRKLQLIEMKLIDETTKISVFKQN